MRSDVLVLGGGVDGLVAAALLARGGRSVTLVEERAELGGPHAPLALAPGFAAPVLPWVDGVRRPLLAPLELEAHGLRWRADAPPELVADGPDGGLLLPRDPVAAGREGALDAASAVALARLRADLGRWEPALVALLDAPPPPVATPSLAGIAELGRTAFRVRRLGRRDLEACFRTAPMAAADWAEERFADERLRAGVVAPALLPAPLGPRAPGTAALVLLRELARGPEPEGGPAALVAALVAACRARGVELRAGTPVERLRLDDDGRAAGAVLEDGSEVAARRVLSTLGLRRTLLALLEPERLASRLEGHARAWRDGGAVAVVRLALPERPRLPAAGGARVERLRTATRLATLERAADATKYGELPEAPWLEGHLAPAERGVVLTLLVHGVPRALRGGWDDAARERVRALALAALEPVAPGAAATAVATEVLTPADLEDRLGLDGGHLFGGDHALDQLWVRRPSLVCARYATPLEGLWLGGPSSHPGGAFPGSAGALAARALLAAS